VTEYRLRVEELSVELRTLQVVVEDLRGCSDDVARLTLELEREKGRMAGRYSVTRRLFFISHRHRPC